MIAFINMKSTVNHWRVWIDHSWRIQCNAALINMKSSFKERTEINIAIAIDKKQGCIVVLMVLVPGETALLNLTRCAFVFLRGNLSEYRFCLLIEIQRGNSLAETKQLDDRIFLITQRHPKQLLLAVHRVESWLSFIEMTLGANENFMSFMAVTTCYFAVNWEMETFLGQRCGSGGDLRFATGASQWAQYWKRRPEEIHSGWLHDNSAPWNDPNAISMQTSLATCSAWPDLTMIL